MLSSMKYENFYKSGIYSNTEMSIFVGWTCFPGSPYENLPIINKEKNVFLFFAGELYDDQQRSISHTVEYRSDITESVIQSYEKYGDTFIKKLNGPFCGFLLDTRLRRVLLFNDRYGMYRLYIHQNREGFYFSSEAKALLAILPETRRFDPVGLGEFLTCGCTIGNHSLYKGISVTPPGSLWISDHGNIMKYRYFNPSEWRSQNKIKEDVFFNSVSNLFSDLIQKYSSGHQDVGISLTGGLDSRMIMSCLGDSSRNHTCYTFGSMYRDSFDVTIARNVAKECGKLFRVIILDDNFLANFEQYMVKAVFISDGYMGMSGAAELYLNSLARSIAPVRLTGNYGGELLRGIRAFKCHIPKGYFITPHFNHFLDMAKISFQEMESADAITFALFHQAPSQGYGRHSIERSQIIIRTPFMDNELVKLIYQAPSYLLKNNRLTFEIIYRNKPELLKIATDRGLRSADPRFVLLARRFYYESLIKSEFWSSHGMPDWIARISPLGLGRLLDKLFLGRNKFQHFYKWSRSTLQTYINEILPWGIENMGEFFDTTLIQKMLQDHKKGKSNYIDEIDNLLKLALINHIFFKSDNMKKYIN